MIVYCLILFAIIGLAEETLSEYLSNKKGKSKRPAVPAQKAALVLDEDYAFIMSYNGLARQENTSSLLKGA